MRHLLALLKHLFLLLSETPRDRRIRHYRSGFTLIELLIVIAIIGLVSVLALPTILTALNERAVVSGAATLQAALVSARDRAANSVAKNLIVKGAPAGIRLLPDPALPGCCNRWVETETPPDYSDGLVRIDTGTFPLPLPSPVLVLEQSTRDKDGLAANPTSWFWCLRIGERVHVGTGAYTIVGPQIVSNQDGFVNVGLPGTISPLDRGSGPVEFIWLVNGRDDDGDGYIDNGYDGITTTYETEHWIGNLAAGIEFATYHVTRRPVPLARGTVQDLPAGCVVDCTDRTRSRLPMNPDGSVDVLLDPAGRLVPTTIYSSPSSLGMGSSFLHFWLADRGDVGLPPKGEARLISLNGRTGKIGVLNPADDPNPHVTAQQ